MVEQQLHQLNLEIRASIGKAACTRDDECKTMAYGEKSCGGPREYLLFSTHETDMEQLKTKVSRYNLLDQQRNALSSLVSDCAFVEEPVLKCLGQICRPAKNTDNYDRRLR